MNYTEYHNALLKIVKKTLWKRELDFDVETPGYGMWSLTAIQVLAEHGYMFDCELHNYENFTKDEWIPLAERVSGLSLYDLPLPEDKNA